MGFCGWLNYVLTLSMFITLAISFLLFIFGLVIRVSLETAFEAYFDPVVKGIDLSKLVSSRHESVVPTKEELPDDINLGSWARVLGNSILLLSTVMIAFSGFGVIASYSRKTVLLVSLAILITCTFVCQFVFLIVLVDLNSPFHQTAMDELYNRLRKDFDVSPNTNHAYSFFLNSIMIMGECCGVYGPADFQGMHLNFTFKDPESKGVCTFEPYYAPACCRNTVMKKGFMAVVKCTRESDLVMINNRGCYLEVYRHVAVQHGDLISAFSAFVLLWEIIQVIMAVSVIFRPKQSEKETIQAAIEATGMTRDELFMTFEESQKGGSGTNLSSKLTRSTKGKASMKAVFVPYSKTSSYQSIEVNRIKSTEIW